MEFGLSEDQLLIQQSLDGYFQKQLPLDEIRRLADDRSGFSEELWQGLCELGIPGLIIPEEYGGTGLGTLDAVVVAEAMGNAVTPAPFVASSIMAPMAILQAANDEQKNAWLSAISTGEMRVAVAAGSLSGTTGQHSLSCDGNSLTGNVTGVVDIAGATHVLCFLSDGSCALSDLNSSNITVASRPTIDRTRPLADISFDGAQAVQFKGEEGVAQRCLNVGRLILSADTLGAGQRMIDKAVEYAGERVQFNRVISSYQAVKHMCAEMVAALEPCRSLIWYAAHAQDDIPEERDMLAHLCKAHMGEVGRDVARTATEVHGGMGFTDLMGLHYWFKRIGYNRQVLGGPEQCRKDAASAQDLRVA